MPIKPENKARYPADWKAIRAAILARARNCCEEPGCMARQYAAGYWLLVGGQAFWHGLSHHGTFAAARQAAAEHSFDRYGDEPIPKGEPPIIVIVLTIAHLDHQPEACDPANLRALCQRHHLAHDAEHHKATAYATRRARLRTDDLFAKEAP